MTLPKNPPHLAQREERRAEVQANYDRIVVLIGMTSARGDQAGVARLVGRRDRLKRELASLSGR